jgi:hypothetical protein
MHTNKLALYKEENYMLLVFNKQKIISYIVVFSTVAILFIGANFITTKEEESIQTSVNTSQENDISNSVYFENEE